MLIIKKGRCIFLEKDISKIDRNFKIETSIKEEDVVFYDVRRHPFRVYGLYNYKDESVFKRMPTHVAQEISEALDSLNYHTAGGRLRFSTNSRYIAIKAKMPNVTVFPHMTLAGTSGFDLYINRGGASTYYKTFMPPVGMQDGYECILYFEDCASRDVTINFPLYNSVSDLYVGLQQTAFLQEGSDYSLKEPVVYYGSSITQGGCASRPGNAYPAIISRMLDCDHINLGFSGSGKGEEAIADYMAGLKMSAFVCDYDYNAPDVEYLNKTHGRLYKKIREKNAALPVILVSRPNFNPDAIIDIQRRDVIYNTYINAINSGDRNIYYIDGQSLFNGIGSDSCTVDGCHPNDLGFMRMAETIGTVLQKVLS